VCLPQRPSLGHDLGSDVPGLGPQASLTGNRELQRPAGMGRAGWGRQWPSGTSRPGWNGKAGPVPVRASERDSTSGQAIQEMLQTPDDRTIACKLAIVTAHTRSSRYACLNPKITKATLTARSAGMCALALTSCSRRP
jgi:hypothetical protein